MSGDFHSRVSADDHNLFAGFGPECSPPESIEDEWSADAPPLPFMRLNNPGADDRSPDGRLTALPWIKRAG